MANLLNIVIYQYQQIGTRNATGTFSKPALTENVREAGNTDFPTGLDSSTRRILMRNIHAQGFLYVQHKLGDSITNIHGFSDQFFGIMILTIV